MESLHLPLQPPPCRLASRANRREDVTRLHGDLVFIRRRHGIGGVVGIAVKRIDARSGAWHTGDESAAIGADPR